MSVGFSLSLETGIKLIPPLPFTVFAKDWEMEGAVANGLWGLRLSDPISCPTGNCTWPIFSTLGICSSCANVTDETFTCWLLNAT